MRVNVQLIDAETSAHLWAERFDKPVTDLLEMQDEIVVILASTLGAQLIEAEARRAERSSRPDAIDLCVQGRHSLNKGLTSKHLAQARHFFERALALDRDNVDALVGLATTELTTASSFMVDERGPILAAAKARLNKIFFDGPASCHGSLAIGFFATVHRTRTAGDWEMRASAGA